MTHRHSNDYEIWKSSWFVVGLVVLLVAGAILTIVFTTSYH